MMDYRDYLEHYGVLGMHWGQRKGEGSVTPSRRKTKQADKLADKLERTTPSEDHKRKATIQRKKLEAMTNQELKTVNERLQLEQSYKNLSPKKLSIGKRFSNSIIGKQVNTSAKSYVSQTAAALVKAAIFV